MQSSPTPTISLNDALTLGEKLGSLFTKCEEEAQIGKESENKILGELVDVQSILTDSNLDSEASTVILNSINDLDDYNNSENISGEDSEKVKANVVACRHLIDKELKEVQTVPVDDSGILDTNKLLESPNQLFSSSVWEWLDEMPRNDLKEACRSLAVGNSTSAVILSLRAVEYCLLEWHETETGDQIDAPWGMLLTILVDYHLSDEKKDGTLPEKLSDLPPVLSNLFYLKEMRNSVNHPKEVPTLQVARRTLIIAVGTIEDIYNELELNGLEPEPSEVLVSTNDPEFAFTASQEVVYDYLCNINGGDGVPRNELYDLLQQEQEMTPKEVDDIIMDLLMSGHAYEPAEGEVRPI